MLLAFLTLIVSSVNAAIDRYSVVSRYNPTRNASSPTTPMQIGNGNFAFGTDVTGLQTFQPFAIMSSWGWKNDSLPPGKTMEDVLDYQGESWYNHGRLVEYDFGGDPLIEQWLISNPNRVNLGRVGLAFLSSAGQVLDVTETNLTDIQQSLDLWNGIITSKFSFQNVPITIETVCAQTADTVGVNITSSLLQQGRLAVFLDFPWNDGTNKFSDPYVGSFNASLAANHTTTVVIDKLGAQINHTLNTATFITSVGGDGFDITRDSPLLHRYTIRPTEQSASFSLSIDYGLSSPQTILPPSAIRSSSISAWAQFWTQSAFVDLAEGSTDQRANELQRRVILSRYLMRVNEAEDTPPQEVGASNSLLVYLTYSVRTCQRWLGTSKSSASELVQ